MNKTPTYHHCPECEGTSIAVYEETAWLLKADGDFEFYCTSTKMQDYDAKARCYDCGWTGVRALLREGNQ